MRNQITPVLLTFNEEANIARTLAKLEWAEDIVVVDSLSSDSTLDILRAHPRIRIFQRPFDSHSQQWNHALANTGIKTPWVLALDADYVLSDDFMTELDRLNGAEAVRVAGYRARFVYCVDGKPLWGSLYPEVVVLFQRDAGTYVQDGHTQRLVLRGAVASLRAPIQHDDRKPLSHWLAAQDRYAALEAAKIRATRFGALSWADRLRKLVVLAPWIALIYCLLVKGTLFQGRAGLKYAFQRTLAELVLSLRLLESRK